MFKNVASQKIAVVAYDTSGEDYKTGDASNITAQISKDGGATAATNDVNPTELDATDAKGVYLFDMTQAETNADLIVVSAVSSTANITIEPVVIYTQTVMRGTDSAALASSLTTHDGKLDTLTTNVGNLNDFDPINDIVANVTLVDTTTSNTDMRGTDSAALASALTTHDGKLDTLTTNVGNLNDFDPTVDEVITNAASRTASKADVSALATSAEIAALNDITVADILAGVIDGAIDLQTSLKRILAVQVNSAAASGTDPKVIAFKNSAGSATVATQSVPVAGTGRTTTF